IWAAPRPCRGPVRTSLDGQQAAQQLTRCARAYGERGSLGIGERSRKVSDVIEDPKVLRRVREGLACAGRSCFRFVRSILEGLRPTLAASAPDDRSLVERSDAWKRTRLGRLAVYGIIVGAVQALYSATGRAGPHRASW